MTSNRYLPAPPVALLRVSALAATLLLPLTARAAVVFDINISFAVDSTFTPGQIAAFSTAEATWESYILSYITPGVTLGTTLTIAADDPAIDGPGGTLGSAGPTAGNAFGGSYLYATAGAMNFDTADLGNMEANGTLTSVILHEMAHVIGIGTFWSSSDAGVPGYQELYVNETGQYTGPTALAAYQQEFVGQESATFVPVELGGGPGTANGHWNEGNGGGSTGIIRVSDSQDMNLMLMTGWLNAGSYISDTTLGSFVDLGYNTTLSLSSSAVPEPGTLALLGWASLIIAGLRKRHACQPV